VGTDRGREIGGRSRGVVQYVGDAEVRDDVKAARHAVATRDLEYGKFRHESQQTPASGDTNSRKWLQVAGVQADTAAPLDQESPDSSPGGATESAASDFPVAALSLFAALGGAE
jgi:hypothetical protein